MKLTIRNLQYGDFGNYRCISKNSLGETEGSIRVYGKRLLLWFLSSSSLLLITVIAPAIDSHTPHIITIFIQNEIVIVGKKEKKSSE